MTAVTTRPPPPARRRRPPDVTEKAWQQQIIDLAMLYGWRHHHQHDSRRSVAGWPDLILVRAPRLVAVELKTRTGKVTAPQDDWLGLLAACGVETYVWRPADIGQARLVLARWEPR